MRDQGKKYVRVYLLGLIGLIVGCSDGSDGPVELSYALQGCADRGDCVSNPPIEVDESRPASVVVPSNYNTDTRYPLIIVLHGAGANGTGQAAYLGLSDRVDEGQYVLIKPEGRPRNDGLQVWDATAACCAFGELVGGDDDVNYLRGLIEQAVNTYSIDPSRIALFGHSNGGFMSLRLACEVSEYVTTIISLAGSAFENAKSCAPASRPVSIMFLHGDSDETVLYKGGVLYAPYPGAVESSERYATLYGCDVANPVVGPNQDVAGSVNGAETTVLAYPDCDEGVEIALWTIVGGVHLPTPWVPEAQDTFVDWLTRHARKP